MYHLMCIIAGCFVRPAIMKSLIWKALAPLPLDPPPVVSVKFKN